MAAAALGRYVLSMKVKGLRKLKKLGMSLKGLAGSLLSLRSGMIAAAGIAGLGFLIKRSMDATDNLGKMSTIIGVSVQNLSRLRHAASIGGMESTKLDKAIQKLAVNMADVAGGTGEALDEFIKYGIKAKDLSSGSMRDVMDVLADVADVTQDLGDSTERTDLIYKLFGARGAGMVNILKDGSAAMHDLMGEADTLGLVMSRALVGGVEAANDSFTRLSSFLTSVFHQAVARLAPLIQGVTDKIREWAEFKIKESGGVAELARRMANGVINASIAIVQGFEDISNAVINSINSLNDFRRTIPEALGGLRTIKDIKEDIAKIDAETDPSKPWPNSGVWVKLHDELELVKASSKAIERVNYQNTINNLKNLSTTKEQAALLAKAGQSALNLNKNKEKGKKNEPSIWDQMKTGFEEYKNSVEAGMESIASLTESALNSTADALSGMMMGIKQDWKSLARSILADLMKFSLKRALFSRSGGGLGELLGFAHGGRPPVGVPSIVGERGPELFIPDRAGTIIPNNQLGSAGTKNVNIIFNITANDTAGFDDLLESRRGMIVGLINNAMNDRGMSGVTA